MVMTTQKYDRSKNEGWAWLRYDSAQSPTDFGWKDIN